MDVVGILSGAALGGIVGALSAFLLSILVLAGERARNRARIGRDLGPCKDEVRPRLTIPGAVVGTVAGGATSPWVGLWGAGVAGLAAFPLIYVLVFTGAVLWLRWSEGRR